VLRYFRRRSGAPKAQPAVPEGTRVYAIGDVHGRLDLLQALIEAIREDNAGRGPASTQLVFLGDLVDRGPSSAQVIEYLLTEEVDFATVHFLAGNHEESFLDVVAGRNESSSASWFRFGGIETLKSYGISHNAIAMRGLQLFGELNEKVPRTHIEFIESFKPHHRIGDYLFVHAGIRPGVPIEKQTTQDLFWIRREFLEDDRDHGAVVVHGHSVSEDVDLRLNRIGIDTGAYKSGRLSALCLEGAERWIVATRPMFSREAGRLVPAIGVETVQFETQGLENDVA
jgi:serine/threonine protein phosphatase 1